MKHRFDGYNWLVRLEKGELLVENLTRLVREQDIKGAWISGLGGAEWAELGFYDLPTKTYKWQTIDQPLEIAGLQGNVAWASGQRSEEPILHIHGTFSDENMSAFGGHVKELEVAGTCEILLHRWYGVNGLERRHNDTIGLNLLDI